VSTPSASVDGRHCHDGSAAQISHAFGATGALLCSGGTVGLAQLLVDWLPSDFDILLSRATSHTVIDALLSRRRNFNYVAADYVPQLDTFGALNIASLEQALKRSPGPTAVFLEATNTQGMSRRIDAVVDLVHGHHPRSVVVADGTHEALFGIHPSLPAMAIRQGPDVLTLSPYMAGALQGSAAMLWQGDRVDPYRLRVAHDKSGPSTQSAVVVESIPAATRKLLQDPERVTRSIEVADLLRRRIREDHPRLVLANVRPNGSPQPDADPMRVTLRLDAYVPTGYELRRRLRQRRIAVEAAGINTLQLLVPLDQGAAGIDSLLSALGTALNGQERDPREPRKPPYDPFATLQERPAWAPVAALDIGQREGVPMRLGDAAGEVVCQRVGVPGESTPVLVPGFRITPSAIDYLETAVAAGVGIDVPGGWTGGVIVAPRWLMRS
jgi:arginine/lysine/ornithine decarboxylase